MIIERTNTIGALSAAAGSVSTWTPLASPHVRAAARAVIADIARTVPSHNDVGESGMFNPNFAGGAAGVALFLHYSARAFDDTDAHDASIDLLGRALEAMHSLHLPGLFSGYTGVAWTVSHLQQRGVDELDDVDLTEIDALVEAQLRRVPWTDDFDLVSGLVGIGVYGLERMRQGAGEGIVAAVVNRLHETVEWMGDGLAAWFHLPWVVAMDEHPEGRWNLGMAHGLSGVLAFLARAVHCDVRRETARRLLAAGARWTTAQLRYDGPDEVSIGFHVDARTPDARTGAHDSWCYCSPGSAIALLATASALNDESLAATALAMARSAAHHDPATARVFDACFCHGASGLAHQYARLRAATGEPAFVDAARRWTDHTLAFRKPGEGVAGFTRNTKRNDRIVRVGESGFLQGSAGVGLGLLSMCSSEPPTWDRVVLADPSL